MITQEQKEILDKQLVQISERLTMEKLCDKIDIVRHTRDLNTELIELLHNLIVVNVQRNNLQLILHQEKEGDTPVNNYGQTEEEALDEINALWTLAQQTVARFM